MEEANFRWEGRKVVKEDKHFEMVFYEEEIILCILSLFDNISFHLFLYVRTLIS